MKITRRQLRKLILESMTERFESPHKRYAEIRGSSIPPEWLAPHPSGEERFTRIGFMRSQDSSGAISILEGLAGAISHMNRKGLVALNEYSRGTYRLVDSCNVHDISDMTNLNSFVELYSSMSGAPIFDLSTYPMDSALLATLTGPDAAEFSSDVGWNPEWGAATPRISGWEQIGAKDSPDVYFSHDFGYANGGQMQVSFETPPAVEIPDVKVCDPGNPHVAPIDPPGPVSIQMERLSIYYDLTQDPQYVDPDGVPILRALPTISKIVAFMRIIKGR